MSRWRLDTGSIRVRFWLAGTGVAALVLLGNGLLVLHREAREVRQSLLRESLTFARLAGPQLLRAFGENFRGDVSDPQLTARVAEVVQGLPALEALGLLGPRGRPLLVYPTGASLPAVTAAALAAGGRQGFRDTGNRQAVEILLPARDLGGGPPVWLQLLVSDEPVRRRVADLRRTYGASLAVLLALAAFLASRVTRRILGPVEALKASALAIRDGDLTVRAPETGGDELAALARAFNAMASEVETGRRELEDRHRALERAYTELQALQQELVASERLAAVGRLAAGVSHEVDNPIGVILGTAEMLRAELADRPDLTEDLAIIEAECKRCRKIVRDLLDLARPPSGHAGTVDVRELAAELLRGLSHHPDFRGIEVTTRWAPALGSVRADPDRLRQVLLNLLLNATEALKRKGKVALEGEVLGGRSRLTVRDEGPGIAAEDLERIFEPFFTTRSGAGLGLAVSRRIVEEQGGRLWAESAPGMGSAFHIELPTGEAQEGQGE